MAHEVSLNLSTKVIASKDCEVVVREIVDGKTQTLGKLLISKGNIEWLPAGNSVNKKRYTWRQFADKMSEAKTVRAKPRKSVAK